MINKINSLEEKFPLIYLEWFDAATYFSTWASEENVKEFCRKDYLVKTIGFVVYEDKKYIQVCGDVGIYDEEKLYNRIIKIPVKWINKRKKMTI